MWAADAHKKPWAHKHWSCSNFISLCRFINIFISTWVLLVAGIIFALPMVYFRIKDHTDLEDEALYVPFGSLSSHIYSQSRAHVPGDHDHASPTEAVAKDWCVSLKYYDFHSQIIVNVDMLSIMNKWTPSHAIVCPSESESHCILCVSSSDILTFHRLSRCPILPRNLITWKLPRKAFPSTGSWILRSRQYLAQ